MKPWVMGLLTFASLVAAFAFVGTMYYLIVLWHPDVSDKEDCAKQDGVFVQGGRGGDDLCLEKGAVIKNYG